MRKKHKQKNNKIGLWAVIVIVILMLSSTIGYVFKGNSNKKYGDSSFSRTDDGTWYTKINGRQFAFNYFPSDIEDINLSNEIINKIKNTNMVYFTYNPENNYREGIAVINLELTNILLRDFKVYSTNGLTKNNTFNAPIIGCNNATTLIPVIYFNESNQTNIYLNNNCIVLNGRTGNDFLALKERLLYGLFGIVK